MYNGSSLARDKVGYKFFFQDAYQERQKVQLKLC